MVIKMLQYIDNVNYSSSNSYSIDCELAELNTLCKRSITDYELYQQIRAYIYREIKIKELAITKVLKDLAEIRKKSVKASLIIQAFICHNDRSYSQIASEFNCSKQSIHQTIQKYSADYIWLQNLIKIKGAEDSKNENNRTRFFSGNKKVDLFEQMDFFDDPRGSIEGTF